MATLTIDIASKRAALEAHLAATIEALGLHVAEQKAFALEAEAKHAAMTATIRTIEVEANATRAILSFLEVEEKALAVVVPEAPVEITEAPPVPVVADAEAVGV